LKRGNLLFLWDWLAEGESACLLRWGSGVGFGLIVDAYPDLISRVSSCSLHVFELHTSVLGFGSLFAMHLESGLTLDLAVGSR
jgi:hypothetical protein